MDPDQRFQYFLFKISRLKTARQKATDSGNFEKNAEQALTGIYRTAIIETNDFHRLMMINDLGPPNTFLGRKIRAKLNSLEKALKQAPVIH